MSTISIQDGIICSSAEYDRSIADPNDIHCLTRGQSIGLVLVAESGFISLFAVLWVFGIIFSNLRYHVRHVPNATIWNIALEPMDVFMLSLFSADLVQAIGAIMDIKWIKDGKVEIGQFCSAQGVIQQLGETGVAITTLVIAVYTFIGVWWRVGLGPRRTTVAIFVISVVWLFVILMVAIGNIIHRDKHQFYQSPTPYWCWIGANYNGFRLGGEYIWLWLTLVFSFLAYIPLSLWSRGIITVDEEKWWKFSVHHTVNVEDSDPGGRRRASYAMIAYPLVFSILVLPLSIVRWIGFQQERLHGKSDIPSSATLAVIAIYGFSGAFNVLLLLITRPASVLFGKRIPMVSHSQGNGFNDETRYIAGDRGRRYSQGYRQDRLEDLGRAPSPEPSLQDELDHNASAGSDNIRVGRLPSIADSASRLSRISNQRMLNS